MDPTLAALLLMLARPLTLGAVFGSGMGCLAGIVTARMQSALNRIRGQSSGPPEASVPLPATRLVAGLSVPASSTSQLKSKAAPSSVQDGKVERRGMEIMERELRGQDFVELLRSLVSESRYLRNDPSMQLVPEERHAAALVRDELDCFAQHGIGPLRIEEFEFEPGRTNLRVTYEATEEGARGKTITFMGAHFDVVPVATMPKKPVEELVNQSKPLGTFFNRGLGAGADPDMSVFQLEQKEDRLYGCGTSSCLGHVALLTQFLCELARSKPRLRHRIVVVFLAGREAGEANIGADALLRNGLLEDLKDGPLIWLDAGDSKLCCGSTGSLGWTLQAVGREAHSAMPLKGINAIELAYEALAHIQQRFHATFQAHDMDPHYHFEPGLTSMKPLRIQCQQTSPSQICHETLVVGDIQVTPFYDIRTLMQDVEGYVNEVNEEISKCQRNGQNGCNSSAKWSRFVLSLKEDASAEGGQPVAGQVKLSWSARPKNASKSSNKATRYQAGDRVEVYSNSMRLWCKGRVKAVEPWHSNGELVVRFYAEGTTLEKRVKIEEESIRFPADTSDLDAGSPRKLLLSCANGKLDIAYRWQASIAESLENQEKQRTQKEALELALDLEGIAVHRDTIGHRALAAAFREVCGEEKEFSVRGSIPHVRRFQNAGFDVQLCGFGKLEKLHQDDEYCSLAAMAKGYQVLCRVVNLLEEDLAEESEEARRCPGGCGFAITWHDTHCCGRCEHGADHGPRCDKRPMPASGRGMSRRVSPTLIRQVSKIVCSDPASTFDVLTTEIAPLQPQATSPGPPPKGSVAASTDFPLQYEQGGSSGSTARFAPSAAERRDIPVGAAAEEEGTSVLKSSPVDPRTNSSQSRSPLLKPGLNGGREAAGAPAPGPLHRLGTALLLSPGCANASDESLQGRDAPSVIRPPGTSRSPRLESTRSVRPTLSGKKTPLMYRTLSDKSKDLASATSAKTLSARATRGHMEEFERNARHEREAHAAGSLHTAITGKGPTRKAEIPYSGVSAESEASLFSGLLDWMGVSEVADDSNYAPLGSGSMWAQKVKELDELAAARRAAARYEPVQDGKIASCTSDCTGEPVWHRPVTATHSWSHSASEAETFQEKYHAEAARRSRASKSIAFQQQYLDEAQRRARLDRLAKMEQKYLETVGEFTEADADDADEAAATAPPVPESHLSRSHLFETAAHRYSAAAADIRAPVAEDSHFASSLTSVAHHPVVDVATTAAVQEATNAPLIHDLRGATATLILPTGEVQQSI